MINPNGAGQDFFKGYVTVTTGGAFAIEDWDNDEIQSAIITLVGTQNGDKLTAVLPQGITSNADEIRNSDGDIVLMLTGPASLNDFQDAIGSVMFQAGSGGGERVVQVQLTDTNGMESKVLEGTVGAGNRSLAASGEASVREWSNAGFKVVGYTVNTIFTDGDVLKGLDVNTVDGAPHGGGVGFRNVTNETNSGRGNGIGVIGGTDARISGGESLVIDVGYHVHSARLTLTNFTSGETANWYAYDKTGALVSTGALSGLGSNTNSNDNTTRRPFELNITGEFQYLVIRGGNGNFLVDGLIVQGRTTATIGEFDFSASPAAQGASIDIESFAAPMTMSLEDDVDLELTTDIDSEALALAGAVTDVDVLDESEVSDETQTSWFDELDDYVAGTSLLDTEDEAFVLIGDKVQHITDDGISNISEYAGVEEIHLDGSVHFDLSYSDLLGSQDLEANSGPLKIFGGEDDVLDFGNNGSDALSNEEGRYADGDNEEAEDYGSWLLNGSVTEDGVTFDVYEYHSSASAGGDDDTKNQVLVQQGIEVI